MTADKYKRITAERIAIQLRAHQRRQAVDALAHIRWRTREKNSLAVRQAQHDATTDVIT